LQRLVVLQTFYQIATAVSAAKARGVKMGNPRYQEALAKARAALT
jgi:hypothetical protein